MAPTQFVLLAARTVVTGGQEPELPGAGAVKRKEGGTTRRSLPPSVVRSVSFLDLVLPRPSDRPTFGRRQWRRRRPMNGSGGSGVGGGEPVTWIVLHWQRCTVAPAAVAMAATAAAAAVESAAPRMQKIVGRRLLPSPPLLRPVHRATERLPQRMRVWLGAGNGCGARSLPRLPPIRPVPTSFPARCSFSIPMGFFFRLALPSPLLLFSSFRSCPPFSPSLRGLLRGRPTGGNGRNRTGSGNVTNNSKLQCIMDTCTHTRSQSSYNL